MLIDPSVSGQPAGSLLSFAMPCFKWKLAGGFKTHWGYSGFDSTIFPRNRYLTKTVVYRLIISSSSGVFGDTTTTSVFTVDQITGAVTANPPGAGDIENTPSPAPITYQGDKIQIADTGTIETGSNFFERQIFTVTLSNPYTIAMLEADVDSLLAGFDPATVPDDTLTELVYPGDRGFSNGIVAALYAMTLIPYPYGYTPGINNFGSPGPLPKLGAAALAAYNPGGTGAFSNIPPGFAKVIGFISMAGAYCLKTYTIDPAGNPIGSPTCVSGSGSCANSFEVTPPSPFALNQNTYVVVVPNCRCGS